MKRPARPGPAAALRAGGEGRPARAPLARRASSPSTSPTSACSKPGRPHGCATWSRPARRSSTSAPTSASSRSSSGAGSATGGRVIAIEPEARNVDSLRRRVQRAGLADTVECVQAVAAAQPGELRLAVNPTHPGDHQIAAQGRAGPRRDPRRADAGEARHVSLVKIDVQGAESMVLAGARSVLEEHRPALFVEVDDARAARLRLLGPGAVRDGRRTRLQCRTR